jgi:hypothetical protein
MSMRLLAPRIPLRAQPVDAPHVRRDLLLRRLPQRSRAVLCQPVAGGGAFALACDRGTQSRLEISQPARPMRCPASAIVGTCGGVAGRRLAVTPSPRTLPALPPVVYGVSVECHVSTQLTSTSVGSGALHGHGACHLFPWPSSGTVHPRGGSSCRGRPSVSQRVGPAFGRRDGCREQARW